MGLEANQEKGRNIKRLGLGCLIFLFLLLAGYYVWKLNQFRQPPSDVYIDRDEWGAVEPTVPINPLTPPVKNVVFYHIPTKHLNRSATITFVKALQSAHMGSLGWPDIGPNFLVGSGAEIFVGRGWDKQPHPQGGYKTESIAIAFLGMFEKEEPSQRQKEAAKRLLKKGVQLQSVYRDYDIYNDKKMFK